MKRVLKCTIVILLALVLLCTGASVASAQTKADEPTSLARKCTYENKNKRKSVYDRLKDRNEDTRCALEPNEWVSVRWKNEPVDFVYFEWTDKIGIEPPPYTIELLDASGNVLETREGERYWNNGIEIADGVHGVRLTPRADAELCTLIPYSGGAPKDYHPWQPTIEKADFLVIAMHPDDDALFMGNVIATYGAERGYAGTILWLATRTRIRRTEGLNGAWIMGLRTYPLMAGLPDIPIKYREEKKKDFLPEDVTLTLVRYLRRMKPEVVITHDDNGEYGHWQHVIVAAAARAAMESAADPDYDPESAAQYGVWQVKKLYLHLAEENPIFISAYEPLAAFDGRTGLQVAQEAYQCHQSQRLWYHICDNQNECSLEKFGLVFTAVGNDSGVNDMFENIDPASLSFNLPKETPTPEPTAEPTEEPTPEPTEEPTAAPTPEPTRETAEAAVKMTDIPVETPEAATPVEKTGDSGFSRADRTVGLALAGAVMLLAIGLAAIAVLDKRMNAPKKSMKHSKKTLILLAAALLLLVCGLIAMIVMIVKQPGGEAPAQAAATEEPQADIAMPEITPEPVTSLTIREASDAETLALCGTIRTCLIENGALSNEETAALVAAYPEVTFAYNVRVGDRFVPSDSTVLECMDGETPKTLAAAVPYLPMLNTVRLGALEPEEIDEAISLFAPLTPMYSIALFGQEFEADTTQLDLSGVDHPTADMIRQAQTCLPQLREVDLGDAADPATVAALIAADTGLEIRYGYSIEYRGKKYTESTETLDLSGEQITDLDELRDVFSKLPKLNHVEMVNCGIDDAAMAELRDAFPNIKIVWEIDLGFWGKLRTDATAYTTRSSKTDAEMKYRLTTEDIQPLQYCTDLVALDLGHQKIKDISCLKTLTKLQILILADNRISDISALASMPDLIYVELFINHISDVSPLSGLTNLKDLNICTNHISDLTPFYSLSSLERLWYSGNDFKVKDHEALQKQLPNCICDRTVWHETEHGWREHERYFWMRSFFENSPRYVKTRS